MRSNARICATVTFSALPLIALWTYRYQTVLKPAKIEYQKKKAEELLAEGKYASGS